ncbi:hypothetical protein A3H80_04385 [Candidatus Roizmanbacteria bacterium RIFCSPLOWO2_02_FULL_37_19]|uniref:2-oxoacid:ferredoxin oxidoreductase subunit alpha n=1 Tax=Candidatus Roizmanbacteria bacterium RIFCSPHIGHO2_02_FULL_37_24 TaxID=1802037 RepID=A0A1F7GVK8_9BACT|nr:MAG: hypothetical protein A2862_04015 [Candidatus Roizmanbacteria bacterium RIFCSPHIGHO2_01_FULL_38_41]OGK23127.1 MAG: hypothetical protein A3C24_01415 [Candidatus Roizmanbacteria bacterium RIFCSPHIGHO2_02_FULL_37_24]OGK32850.1 MAG: hypothetical protein A3E10_00075 [Candidatus Roizmanbacteria bacterium RIFCSPHIGHO2_12_FULL_37_23]OGK45473.1 MAG: hypothetical protein A2956_00085 [Candidatus Roizmanbacteria bacterium RIFCSPLOWO2_01_FULL_37_57]OGK54263.1 MAG: hypothetical protein A3H80_04385 [Ca
MQSLLWKIGGEAGFGIMTTGLDFAKIATRQGYQIAGYMEYPSLIRGGHNTYEIHISVDKLHSSKYHIDVLVCLNKETFDLYKKRLSPDSIVFYDKEMFEITDQNITALHLPLKETLKNENAPVFMMNTITIGASMAVFNWPLEVHHAMIEKTFGKKGEEVVSINKKMSQIGYDYVKQHYPDKSFPAFQARKTDDTNLVMTGNDAFSLGALIGDCRLYSAYPMTPTSTVLTRMAEYAEKVGIVVRHAEDEISVINTALGSAFAGVRSSVGTSGGGFALMTESLSFAGVAEIPVVIFLGQRPGPATGMPTWTEQGDLLFAVHAGHGEFPKIVLAPGNLEEMYSLTAEAFNLADRYQTPVIVISDKHVNESIWSTSKIALKLFSKSYEVDRGKIASEFSNLQSQISNYKRYQFASDGISPMLIPGLQGHFYQANSYEHIEDGHTTELSKSRVQQVNKRNKKEITYLKNHFKGPEIIGDINTSDVVFVSWGSNKGSILDAMQLLKEVGKTTSLIHFTHLFPLDEKAIQKVFKLKKRYILIENNSHGQFGRLLRQQTGIDIEEKLLKYDGRQIFREEIIDYLKIEM